MTRSSREFGISAVAALALGLAALPAEAQTVAPVLPATASGTEWAQFLSTPASADQTTAAADRGSGQLWKRFGIGAGALGASGIFSFYVASATSSPRPLAKQGAAPPAAPKSADPGPVVSQPGQPGTEGAPSPATPSAGSQGTSTASTAAGADEGSSSSPTAQAGPDDAASTSTPDAGSAGTIESTGLAAGWESTSDPVTVSGGSIAADEIAPATAGEPMFVAAAPATTVTPEPATLVLLMSGALALLFLNRRRRTA